MCTSEKSYQRAEGSEMYSFTGRQLLRGDCDFSSTEVFKFLWCSSLSARTSSGIWKSGLRVRQSQSGKGSGCPNFIWPKVSKSHGL